MQDHSNEILFSHFHFGTVDLKHRIVMAPLTRLRADVPAGVPSERMLEYYTQRATSGGLIISEATSITPTNLGYLGAPGIYSDEQVAAWSKITDAVHTKGGYMFLQLWHVGRTGHAELSEGQSPVAPSVVPYVGRAYTKDGWVPVTTARELTLEGISEIVEQYRVAATKAVAAGFDGVEIHAANGYLLDQFLQDGSNKRTDRYGGSVANRARLLLEVASAVKSVWGPGGYSVRLSPSSSFNGMGDSDPAALFDYAVTKLNEAELAYLHIIEPRVLGSIDVEGMDEPIATRRFRGMFSGPIITAGGYDGDKAEKVLEGGDADLVAFGRYFISNPDLPKRLRTGAPLNPYDRDTFYGGSEKGYLDYPFLETVAAE